LCGVSPRTVDYYTQRGLLEPSRWSPGRQRRYDDQAVQRLRLIKELQSERLTLREITDRLTAATAGASSAALAARISALEGDLDRLNREMAALAPHLDQAENQAEQQAVARVAGLALARTLALAQWLTALVREGQTSPPL
jgi:DNA-binding transcriptional MerR regulator